MPSVAKSIEELFPLIESCKAGDLRAVSKWIAAGNPLDPPGGKKTRRASPLEIAIEKGFLTLTEMLLDAGSDPFGGGKNSLASAVRAGRRDIAELLLDRGVPIDSIDFPYVCCTAQPDLIKLCLDRGADPFKGDPFFQGFLSCLKPMLGVYKTYIEKIPELQVQANMALCHYAKMGNLRCVSLLIWAGAQPDADIPEDASKEFGGSCALAEAAQGGLLNILKRMKVEAFPKKLPDLIKSCTIFDSPEILEFLLGLMPSLDTLPEEETTALDHVLWRLGWAADPKDRFGTNSPKRIDDCIKQIELLVKHGARWKPTPNSVKTARGCFRHLEPSKIFRVFEIFKENNVVETSFLESLVSTSTMKAHLGGFSQKIADLFNPPPVRLSSPALRKDTIPLEVAKASLSELRLRAKAYVFDTLRNIPYFRFWDKQFRKGLENQKVRRSLGLTKEDERSCYEIFNSILEDINRHSKTFDVSVDGNEYRGTIDLIRFTLKDQKEWVDVIDEIWSSEPSHNPLRITEPSLKLLDWIRDHGSQSDWVPERALSWKAGFKGAEGRVDACVTELKRKMGPAFQSDIRGKRWDRGNPIEYQVWLAGEIPAKPFKQSAPSRSLNPVLPWRLNNLQRDDIDALRESIYSYILVSSPVGLDPLYLIWIDNRRELERIFPANSFEESSGGQKIADLFARLHLDEEVVLEFSFNDSSHVWFVRVVPKQNWGIALSRLKDLQNRPSLQQQYGLSDDSAKLVRWIEELRRDEFLGSWTPMLEGELERGIGIKCPWDKENLSAYIQVLLNEINEKTDYDLTLQPWKHYSEWRNRICVRKKQTDESRLIQSIQFFGLQRGKLLQESQILDLLSQLLE